MLSSATKCIAVVLAVIMCASTVMKSQSKAMMNITNYNLKGNVEKIFLESYKAKHTKDTMNLKYDSGLMGIESQMLFFNLNGTIRKIHEYASYSKGDSIIVDKIWTYHYSNNNVDSITSETLNVLTTNKIEYNCPYKYDYKGDSIYYLTTDFLFPRTSRITTKTTTRIREYLDKDSVAYITEITFKDTTGRIKRSESYSKDKLTRLTIRNFYETHEVITQDSYTLDIAKNTVKRSQNKLNKNGDVIKTTIYKSNGEYQTHWSREYEYDDQGNWVSQKKFNYKGKLRNLYKRTIKYRSKN